MEDLNSSTRTHRMTMTNRKNCTLNGVNDVLSKRLKTKDCCVPTEKQNIIYIRCQGEALNEESVVY